VQKSGEQCGRKGLRKGESTVDSLQLRARGVERPTPRERAKHAARGVGRLLAALREARGGNDPKARLDEIMVKASTNVTICQ